MGNAGFRGVAAGEQLGNLEYLIDDSVVVGYQRLVDKSSYFANLIADDCVTMAMAKFGDVGWDVIWRRFDFLRPPIPGRRIQAGAWLKEVREVEQKPWLRVSAFAVDEIGTEILRSEAALAAGRAQTEVTPPSLNSVLTSANAAAHGFDGRVGESIGLGEWVVPATESVGAYRELRIKLSGTKYGRGSQGTGQLLAGWLEGRIGGLFGDDFRWGGRLSLAYHAPIAPGDLLSADAVLIEQDQDRSGTSMVRLSVGVWNHCNRRVAVGHASISIPSPRLL